MRRHKYNAKPAVIDGHKFPSKAEAARYGELKLMAAAGLITSLQLQPSFVLQKGFTDNKGEKHRAIKYVADFQYIENGATVVEDVKGIETPVFKIKLKLLLNLYRGIDFRLIS